MKDAWLRAIFFYWFPPLFFPQLVLLQRSIEVQVQKDDNIDDTYWLPICLIWCISYASRHMFTPISPCESVLTIMKTYLVLVPSYFRIVFHKFWYLTCHCKDHFGDKSRTRAIMGSGLGPKSVWDMILKLNCCFPHHLPLPCNTDNKICM